MPETEITTTNEYRGKHTRGPWELRRDPRRGVSIVSMGGGIETNSIAYVQFAGTDLADGLANANLIAAAPDLLKACKEYREACAAAMRVLAAMCSDAAINAWRDELKQLGIADGFGVRGEVAIAKAEGK